MRIYIWEYFVSLEPLNSHLFSYLSREALLSFKEAAHEDEDCRDVKMWRCGAEVDVGPDHPALGTSMGATLATTWSFLLIIFKVGERFPRRNQVLLPQCASLVIGLLSSSHIFFTASSSQANLMTTLSFVLVLWGERRVQDSQPCKWMG